MLKFQRKRNRTLCEPHPRCEPGGQISGWPVQPFAQKYSSSRFAQIKTITHAVLFHRGAARDRHERGAGCDGRWCCFWRTAREADGEVVWFWCPDAGIKFCGKTQDDGGNKARSPGRARRKPL